MKFIIKGPFRENIYSLMRKTSYYLLKKDGQRNELELTWPAKGYPRFHLFVKIHDDTLIFNLHLDQKKPIYKGVPAHAGEYGSENVRKEADRIKQILSNAKN